MKRRKQKRKSQLLIILIIFSVCYLGAYKFSQSGQVQGFINEIIEVSGPSTTFIDSSLEAPTIKGQAAILMDASSGEILMKQDADIAFPVASMSKLMTEYIVQEQIQNKDMEWDDLVQISQSANNMDPQAVKIYVKDNDSLTVRDLYNAMVISSANNATRALAEHIAGTEKKFAKLMNNKAKEMGLSSKTNFVNSTGLLNIDGSENVMTAADVAGLAYQLLRNFPDVVETTNLLEYELAYDNTNLKNSNSMLYPENRDLYFNLVDGLKTGYTETAGYCFAGTAKQGDKRFISVVMGTKSDDARFRETHKLLSFGFENF
ncbi:D-alanyl-D-alanine carboxypeptidase [Psychrobacillus sp. INOP01]|uniref:D-alanyl-D-alanine carboxypeptidase family protein n=1 Tax=Psychrobacillus sp. INOP01 TaxID=2829187 RepID=UPI001BA6ACB0|nr:D-alanyl-D-alanine carboxypeptidase family protein [Psychrobacillus sp. INOP01]QUG43425.1 D-alanyl-D-alanine carboxypeptidase [Psychrobacillus sp. INOP01]